MRLRAGHLLSSAVTELWRASRARRPITPAVRAAAAAATLLLLSATLVGPLAPLQAGEAFAQAATPRPPDFNADGFSDLAIGAPLEDLMVGSRSSADAGAVNVIYGSVAGLAASGNQLWSQASPGVPGDIEEEYELFGYALAWADFNRDGYTDLAIGVPSDRVTPSRQAGSVNVLYGSATGLSAAGSQIWSQATAGASDGPEFTDFFGFSLAAGDFNGDGFGDLAIGVPNEAVGIFDDAGAVNVLYGSAAGLANANAQFWTQSRMGLPTAAAGEFFGWSLAAGDFNGDGRDDLAVGARGERAPVTNHQDAGAVSVLYGSTGSGLTAATAQFWQQDDLSGATEGGDQFGSSLAAGDFNDDGRADLAVGAPYEELFDTPNNPEFHGAVNVIYGGASGLSAGRNQFWHQDRPGILGTVEYGDFFGLALATGDFDADGRADLAIGVNETLEASGKMNAGAVNVIYGAAGGLTRTGNQLWHQDKPGVESAANDNDSFGSALSTGDFDGDTFADLAIGAPGETLFPDSCSPCYHGVVNVLYGTAANLSATGDQLWHQNRPGIKGASETGDFFGGGL